MSITVLSMYFPPSEQGWGSGMSEGRVGHKVFLLTLRVMQNNLFPAWEDINVEFDVEAFSPLRFVMFDKVFLASRVMSQRART